MLMTYIASVDTERVIPLKAKWILFVTASGCAKTTVV